MCIFIFYCFRCYNCGDFGNYIVVKCLYGFLLKRCYNCKFIEYFIVDCFIWIFEKLFVWNGNNGNIGFGDGYSFGIGGLWILKCYLLLILWWK